MGSPRAGLSSLLLLGEIDRMIARMGEHDGVLLLGIVCGSLCSFLVSFLVVVSAARTGAQKRILGELKKDKKKHMR